MDSRKAQLVEFFKTHFGRNEIDKLFPGKEVNFIQINYIKHHDYKKGDTFSNLDGMALMTLEFNDGTKEHIRWKDPRVLVTVEDKHPNDHDIQDTEMQNQPTVRNGNSFKP